MSGDPELYIWPWAKSIKLHKQRDLVIVISKHFEVFEIGPAFAKLWVVEICTVPF